jgi:precorrin-6B methylase 2
MPLRLCCVCLLVVGSGGLRPPLAFADDAPKPAAKDGGRYEYRRAHDPNGIGKFYMGREIALVMGHLGAGWLDRPEREKEEQPAKLMAALKLAPGMRVADIGAGSGYFTFRLAKEVGPKGTVYAVDIQKEMLDIIRARAKKQNVENVELVLGSEADPKLKPGTVDLALMVDVYHEFEFPYEMTEALVRSLAPKGRLVFVEYRKEDPEVPIKEVHKMFQDQVKREMRPHPLRWVETVGTLPRQHVIVFEKTAAPATR